MCFLYIINVFFFKIKNKRFNESFTRMLSLPSKREETVSMSWVRWGRDDTSQTDPLTLKPLLFHTCNISSSSFWFREHVWTVAPNAANSSTIACLTHNRIHIKLITITMKFEQTKIRKVTNPMPRVPPVTRAVVPWRDHLLFLLLISVCAGSISPAAKFQ